MSVQITASITVAKTENAITQKEVMNASVWKDMMETHTQNAQVSAI